MPNTHLENRSLLKNDEKKMENPQLNEVYREIKEILNKFFYEILEIMKSNINEIKSTETYNKFFTLAYNFCETKSIDKKFMIKTLEDLSKELAQYMEKGNNKIIYNNILKTLMDLNENFRSKYINYHDKILGMCGDTTNNERCICINNAVLKPIIDDMIARKGEIKNFGIIIYSLILNIMKNFLDDFSKNGENSKDYREGNDISSDYEYVISNLLGIKSHEDFLKIKDILSIKLEKLEELQDELTYYDENGNVKPNYSNNRNSELYIVNLKNFFHINDLDRIHKILDNFTNYGYIEENNIQKLCKELNEIIDNNLGGFEYKKYNEIYKNVNYLFNEYKNNINGNTIGVFLKNLAKIFNESKRPITRETIEKKIGKEGHNRFFENNLDNTNKNRKHFFDMLIDINSMFARLVKELDDRAFCNMKTKQTEENKYIDNAIEFNKKLWIDIYGPLLDLICDELKSILLDNGEMHPIDEKKFSKIYEDLYIKDLLNIKGYDDYLKKYNVLKAIRNELKKDQKKIGAQSENVNLQGIHMKNFQKYLNITSVDIVLHRVKEKIKKMIRNIFGLE